MCRNFINEQKNRIIFIIAFILSLNAVIFGSIAIASNDSYIINARCWDCNNYQFYEKHSCFFGQIDCSFNTYKSLGNVTLKYAQLSYLIDCKGLDEINEWAELNMRKEFFDCYVRDYDSVTIGATETADFVGWILLFIFGVMVLGLCVGIVIANIIIP
jgi:hypothetical protein